jgi:hypothetical protein
MEPIIKSKFDKFCEKMDIKGIQEGVVFEKFVNHSILVGHQPDAFNGDSELFDFVNVGGSQDMGIDGIAVKINGVLIRNLEEIQDLMEKKRDIDIEFIFIQAKSKSNFDKGDFLKFTFGVKEFLSEEQKQPVNEKIRELIDIKKYLTNDDVLYRLSKNPTVRLYYVVMGKWCDDPQLTSVAKDFKGDIINLNAYEDIFINFIDSKQFNIILNSNENKFEVTINTMKIMALPETDLVENSCVLLCNANELNKILISPDGLIRKSLFEDNVRDYQGDNSINKEISKTITKEPQKFALLNNGITIVCEKFNQVNDKVVIKNPQIVNGCQTSHVIFNNFKNKVDLSTVPLIIKLISTENDEITNQIVRSTNRQNIVYEEAFEVTKPFHKELEEYINTVSTKYEQFYYERRSKQYNHNPLILNFQKINLRIIVQTFVGMFLCEPHNSCRHEIKLIELYKNVIFQGHQSKMPYFTASLAFYKLEKYFRQNRIDKKYSTFRHHILMIFRELIGGTAPNVNAEKNMEMYCNKILDVLKDDTETYSKYKEAIKIFDDTKDEWIEKLKRDRFGIKDVKEFTELLLKNMKKETTYKAVFINDNEYTYSGEIVTIRKDRYGKRYGFISHQPSDIFFHQEQSKSLDLSNDSLIGHTVYFKITEDNYGKIIAKDVKLI